jgi:type II secretory pathway component PulM
MYLQVWKPVARRTDREDIQRAIEKIRTLHAVTRDAVEDVLV